MAELDAKNLTQFQLISQTDIDLACLVWTINVFRRVTGEPSLDVSLTLPSLKNLNSSFWPVAQSLCTLQALTFKNTAAREDLEVTLSLWEELTPTLTETLGISEHSQATKHSLCRIFAGVAVTQREWMTDVGFSALDNPSFVATEGPVYSLEQLINRS